MRDYILQYKHHGVEYDVHLIDSPGFDDGTANDAEVLSRIATYVNMIYKLKHTIAGVLYLHDITKAKMGGVGIRNVRMLEKMIGVEKWDNCTFVTTKWGCTSKPANEERREHRLTTDPKYFKSMCENAKSARMMRFDGSRASALSILQPHLGKKFAPAISQQMVDEHGPKLALGETDAGRVVADGLAALLEAEKRTEELTELNRVLEQKFDEALFKEFKEKRDLLARTHALHRVGRWAARGVILGGGVVATIFTLGPGASVFALAPAFETVAKAQKRTEKEQALQLEADYRAQSRYSQKLSRMGSKWLKNGSIKELKHLDTDDGDHEDDTIASSVRSSFDQSLKESTKDAETS